MTPPSPKLRTQLAAAMIVAVILSIVFGYIGLNVFARWQESAMLQSLDANARHTRATIDAGGQPPARDVVALFRRTQNMALTIDKEQDQVLVLLACLASLLGVCIGLMLATRFTGPIEAVSRAAGRIASGDLAARACTRARGAGELSRLVDDFNAMAAALEAFDRDVREGSAAIAHELRTPLTILRGRLQGQLDGVFDVDSHSTRSLIDQVELLARIVDDLQTLSMANTGRLDLRSETSDLAPLLLTQMLTLRPVLTQAGISVSTQLEAVSVIVDTQRIGQVVNALVDNVRRHAAVGGQIDIDLYRDGDYAILAISDRGPGLPEGKFDKMFERFWRGEPSRNREHGGSGLGLSVAAAIVAAHGGSIVARARSGGGLCIEVRLAALR